MHRFLICLEGEVLFRSNDEPATRKFLTDLVDNGVCIVDHLLFENGKMMVKTLFIAQ